MSSKPRMQVISHDHDTQIDQAEYDAFVSRYSDPTPPVVVPEIRRYPSASGSGASIPTTGRIPTLDGHAPVVIGAYARTLDDDENVTYAPTGGTPTNWSSALPDPTALPRTETRVTRSRKGRTSFKPVGPRPRFSVTGGVTDYVDPIADMAANVAACDKPAEHVKRCRCALTESRLIAMADTFLECHASEDAKSLRLIGNAVTHPQIIPGDRSSLGVVNGGERSAMGAIIVSNGDLGAYFGIDGMSNLTQAGSAKRGNPESKLTWPTRFAVSPANRLHTRSQLAKASLSVLGTYMVPTHSGRTRKVRIIGRRMADRTALVSFTDQGWFVGHVHHAQASKPAAARVARLATRRQERDNARAVLRSATMSESAATGRAPYAIAVATLAAVGAPSSPLQTIRGMALGETLAGLTRTHASRWTDGTSTYASHATAALALAKALVTA